MRDGRADHHADQADRRQRGEDARRTGQPRREQARRRRTARHTATAPDDRHRERGDAGLPGRDQPVPRHRRLRDPGEGEDHRQDRGHDPGDCVHVRLQTIDNPIL